MKSALNKDFIRDILKSKGRFLSIVTIVALGVAFFIGVKSSPIVMKTASDKYYDDNNLMDIRLLSSMGLTDDDVNEIKNIKGVEWEEREFEDSDVEGVRFVIAAAGDEELDEHITSLCNDKGIFINVVDVKDKCDFIFPSVVSRGKLEIGISSSGASPRITTLLAGEIDNILPDNIEEILDYLEKLRPYAKQKISNDVLRARFLSYMAELTYSRRNIPDDEELEKILNKFLNPIETI